MAIIEIKKYPDPILSRESAEIKEITPEIKKLAEDMIETMEYNQGVGLAAVQVGELKRLMVVQIKQKPLVLINPKIIKKTKETEAMEEGCLSCPGICLEIKRARGIEMEALGKDGKKIKIKTKDILAHILQHEIDHLDGILIIDKINLHGVN